jgi:lipopolysaccharide export LptBFGC system permease protein LptF
MIGRKLDRHVLFSFLGPYLASVAGLAVLLVLFDLFERVDECFRLITRKETGALPALGIIGTYYAGRVLAFVSGYGGLACLSGGALTVAVLHRNGELIAMRAAGISMRRAFVPLLLFALLMGAGQLALSEYAVRPLAPAADDALNKIYFRVPRRNLNVEVSRPARIAVWTRTQSGDGDEKVFWKSGKTNVTIKAGEVLRGGRLLRKFQVSIFPGKLLEATEARWQRGKWRLSGGKFWTYSDDKGFEKCSSLTCDITPTRLEARSLGLAGMGLDDLFEMRNDQAARVEIWQRLSLPASNVILLLIGLPLAVLGSARGGRLLPLGMALMLGAVYVLFGELGAMVARGGDLLDFLESQGGGDWLAVMGGPLRLAVDLAAGLPHLLFLILGAVLYWRVDR